MHSTLFQNAILVATIFMLYGTQLKAADDSKLTNSKFNLSETVCDQAPRIYCPPFVWLKPTEENGPDRTGYPTVDPGGPDCSEPIVDFYDETIIINSCHKIITRIWIATNPDYPDLIDTCHQTIKQVDEEAPMIMNGPGDLMVYADRANCRSFVDWEDLVIYDNVLLLSVEITGERNNQTFELGPGDYFDEGVTKVTYTATDYCGNIATYMFTVTIMCAECHIDCPDNACVPIGSDISPDVLGYAVSYQGNMNCGNATIDYHDMMIETGCNGAMIYWRVWSAEFETMPGFEYTCMQTIELKNDSEINLSECPEDIVVANNFTEVHWADPSASNGANIVYLTSNYQPGGFFPVGITTVIYTAKDDCGNEEQCSFKISVLEDATYDDCQGDFLTSCDGNGGAVLNWEVPIYDGNCSECAPGKAIPGFVYVGSLNGSHYYCSASNYTYHQAQEKAAKQGGYIVSINSHEENEFVRTHIGSATAMIGLSDFTSEGNFIWDSGEDLGYTNWFDSQPNDQYNNQDIVEIMRSGKWNDVDSDKALEFVMEIPCEYVTQIEGPKLGTYVNTGIYTIVYRIADGCGFEKYCSFTVNVEAGIWLTCIGDRRVEAPSDESSVQVTWTLPFPKSCCEECPQQIGCAEVFQIEGPPIGSSFDNPSITKITYRATDPCGHQVDCSFNVIVETRDGNRSSDDDPLGGLIDRDVNKKPEQIYFPEELKLYPNPVKDIIRIEDPNYQQVESILVFSQEGQVSKKYSENISLIYNIEMSELTQGLYIIQINYKDKPSLFKRIIKL